MQPKQEVTRSSLPNGARGKSYVKYGSKGNHLLGYGKAQLAVCVPALGVTRVGLSSEHLHSSENFSNWWKKQS